MIYDVIIIGGGASGLCAAIKIKQSSPKTSVLILESLPRVGKKLATTGNGRCNITNMNITSERYHGKNPQFSEYALNKYNNEVSKDFFYEIGVNFSSEGDKVYPSSFQAASVVDALRFTCEDLGVKIFTETKVDNIMISSEKYKVLSDNMHFISTYVIVASGLYSGGDKLGCDGSMLGVMKKAGFKSVPTTPAIVQLKTEIDIVKQLKGIKVNALVTLKRDGTKVRAEYGETLFCDYGLSGPPVLQISREASRGNGDYSVSLDIMPDVEFRDLCAFLQNRVSMLSYRKMDEFFTGFINKRLGQVILKMSGCGLSDAVTTIDARKIKTIASNIKNMTFKVVGTTGFNSSQVTAGGLSTTEFDDKTMMAKSSKNLYAIGEILDIDGDCGGFNLQWAWSSAMCAADSIISLEEKNDCNK